MEYYAAYQVYNIDNRHERRGATTCQYLAVFGKGNVCDRVLYSILQYSVA